MTGLKQTLTLRDAIAINLGAIIGSGIFVVTGIAAGEAGPALFISILVAAAISLLTALSLVTLSGAVAREGGILCLCELLCISLRRIPGRLDVHAR